MNSSRHQRSGRRPASNHLIEFTITSLGGLLWLLVFYILPLPAPPRPGLDPSWQALLVEQFLHNWQFGRDIVFTYGPWGFLAEPRGDSAIYPWLVLGRLVMALGMSAGTAWVAVNCIRRRVYRWIWLIIVLSLASPVSFLPLLLLCILVESKTSPGREVCLAVLVPACALTAHVKFTAFPLVALLALAQLYDDALIRKRLPVVFLALAGCYFGFYATAGQQFSFLWAYISNAWSMALSYSSGLYKSGSPSEVALGFLLCAVMAASYARALYVARGRAALVDGLWIAVFFFLCFKEAFTRQDPAHLWMGMMNAAIPASIFLIPVLARYGHVTETSLQVVFPARTKTFAISMRGLLTVFVATQAAYFALQTARGAVRGRVQGEWEAVTGLHVALAGREARAEYYQKQLATLRAADPLEPLSGTVDIMPTDVSALFANSLRYQPRPIPQSYTTLNDRLARRNAGFLSGQKRPDFILFDTSETDEQIPSMNDNLAWRTLLTHYEPAGYSGSYLKLRSSREPRDVQPSLISSTTISWNEELPIPSGGAIWAEIEVLERPLNALAGLLLRPYPVEMRITVAGGSSTYRFIPQIGRSGFLLSPIVDGPIPFVALYMGAEGGALLRPALAISFATGAPESQSDHGSNWANRLKALAGNATYAPYIVVRLYRLQVPERDPSAVLSSELIRLAQNAATASTLKRKAQPPSWRIAQSHLQLQVNAPSTALMPNLGAGHSLEFGFGLRNACYDLPEPRSVVRFRIAYRAADARPEQILFDRSLSVRGVEEAAAREAIRLPMSAGGTLVFETIPVEGNCFSGAHWSQVTTH